MKNFDITFDHSKDNVAEALGLPITDEAADDFSTRLATIAEKIVVKNEEGYTVSHAAEEIVNTMNPAEILMLATHKVVEIAHKSAKQNLMLQLLESALGKQEENLV